jgi:MFS transporter, NNP family, nitrate/nitrite transporter
VIIFIQPAVLNSFFPSGFAALSSVAPPSLRSVINAIGPPVSFLMGGGLLPAMIGYLDEVYSFSVGLILTGACMLFAPLLILPVRLGWPL